MYDHDPCEVEELGWEEFIARQWESIFIGYRAWVGLRRMGRRWSDLFEAGLGCSQEIADRLVQNGLINGPDRGLQEGTDAQSVVSGMIGVLTDLRADLAGMAEREPEVSSRLLAQHARLLRFVRVYASGRDDVEVPGEAVTVAGAPHKEVRDELASVPVAVAASRIEAELIVGMLRSHGLTAIVSADDAGGQEPPLQMQGVRVLVPPSGEASARRLLKGL